MQNRIEKTAINMLYERYSELYPINSEVMKEGYQKLEEHLQSLSLEEKNTVFKIVCNICAENERIAFQKGIQMGVKLAEELVE